MSFPSFDTLNARVEIGGTSARQVTVVRFSQLNAALTILLTLAGMMTEEILLHPLKAPEAISVTVGGITA